MEHIRVNDRIRLEKIKLSMAPVIFETIDRDRDYLKQWLPFIEHTLQVSDTEAFIKSLETAPNNRDRIYSIWYKESFAGLIGFKDTDWVNRKSEIGYWLANEMQHRGIITACVQQLVKYSFNKLKLHRIQIKVAENNNRSEAVPQKLGFAFEGIERAGELHGDSYLNLKIYGLLSTDERAW